MPCGKINVALVGLRISVSDASNGDDPTASRLNGWKQTGSKVVGGYEVYLKDVIISRSAFVTGDTVGSRIQT